MGMISGLMRALFLRGGAVGLLNAGTRLTNAISPDATRQLQLGHDAFVAVQQAQAQEYQQRRAGWFDGFVNGLNRLPRPMLALGTLGLFVHAMVDPTAFAARMQGLAAVPEPLWWLLGAVVAFYFGARETHYLREHRSVGGAIGGDPVLPVVMPDSPPENPALRDWQAALDDPNRERG